MKGNGYKGGSCLCPISLGFALGITAALFCFITMVWIMYNGVPTHLAALGFPANPTWAQVFGYAFMGLLKGFFFGVVLALLYDFFVCTFKSRWGSCGCGCTTCSAGDKCGCNCCSTTKNRR